MVQETDTATALHPVEKEGASMLRCCWHLQKFHKQPPMKIHAERFGLTKFLTPWTLKVQTQLRML